MKIYDYSEGKRGRLLADIDGYMTESERPIYKTTRKLVLEKGVAVTNYNKFTDLAAFLDKKDFSKKDEYLLPESFGSDVKAICACVYRLGTTYEWLVVGSKKWEKSICMNMA